MGMGNLANDSIREVSKDHVDQREQLETVQKVPATLMNLPQELKDMIWKQVCRIEPEQVHVRFSYPAKTIELDHMNPRLMIRHGHIPLSQTAIPWPVIFQICKESQEFALKEYIKLYYGKKFTGIIQKDSDQEGDLSHMPAESTFPRNMRLRHPDCDQFYLLQDFRMGGWRFPTFRQKARDTSYTHQDNPDRYPRQKILRTSSGHKIIHPGTLIITPNHFIGLFKHIKHISTDLTLIPPENGMLQHVNEQWVRPQADEILSSFGFLPSLQSIEFIVREQKFKARFDLRAHYSCSKRPYSEVFGPGMKRSILPADTAPFGAFGEAEFGLVLETFRAAAKSISAGGSRERMLEIDLAFECQLERWHRCLPEVDSFAAKEDLEAQSSEPLPTRNIVTYIVLLFNKFMLFISRLFN